MKKMSTQIIPWTIEIINLKTKLRVGIWEHEREFQPIHINLSIRAIAPASPESIEDCLNYQPICSWMVNDWPQQQHTALLETKLRELMCFIFNFDSRIEWADIAISKTQAIQEAHSVGVRMALSRCEYEEIFGLQELFVNININNRHPVDLLHE